MIYDECPLYKLQSKKILKFILGIDKNYKLKQAFIAERISLYISNKGKPRLIEPSKSEIQAVQTRIKNMLCKIKVPENIFSGVKGRSYVDNARMHMGVRYLYKIDFSAFFPSIKRETVYNFFFEDLQCSADIANILTNYTTVDIYKADTTNINTIIEFLTSKKVKSTNHLISGSPASQILSYLVNHKMFDELQNISNENGVTMSVYVDDITFSSEFFISCWFKNKVYKIIKKYNYQLSKKKVKSYSKIYPKLVTGVIIDSSGNMTIKNSLRQKIIQEHEYLRKHPTNDRLRLRGLVTAAKQINNKAYPTVREFAFKKT